MMANRVGSHIAYRIGDWGELGLGEESGCVENVFLQEPLEPWSMALTSVMAKNASKDASQGFRSEQLSSVSAAMYLLE